MSASPGYPTLEQLVNVTTAQMIKASARQGRRLAQRWHQSHQQHLALGKTAALVTFLLPEHSLSWCAAGVRSRLHVPKIIKEKSKTGIEIAPWWQVFDMLLLLARRSPKRKHIIPIFISLSLTQFGTDGLKQTLFPSS